MILRKNDVVVMTIYRRHCSLCFISTDDCDDLRAFGRYSVVFFAVILPCLLVCSDVALYHCYSVILTKHYGDIVIVAIFPVTG